MIPDVALVARALPHDVRAVVAAPAAGALRVGLGPALRTKLVHLRTKLYYFTPADTRP